MSEEVSSTSSIDLNKEDCEEGVEEIIHPALVPDLEIEPEEMSISDKMRM